MAAQPFRFSPSSGALQLKSWSSSPSFRALPAASQHSLGGVVAAVLGIGLAYLTHFGEASYLGSFERSKRYFYLRNSAHMLAVIAFVVSIACFVFGMISVRVAIKHLAH
jgi:hypothetical protein